MNLYLERQPVSHSRQQLQLEPLDRIAGSVDEIGKIEHSGRKALSNGLYVVPMHQVGRPIHPQSVIQEFTLDSELVVGQII